MAAKSKAGPVEGGVERKCATATDLLFGGAKRPQQKDVLSDQEQSRRVMEDRRSQIAAFGATVDWARDLRLDLEATQAYTR